PQPRFYGLRLGGHDYGQSDAVFLPLQSARAAGFDPSTRMSFGTSAAAPLESTLSSSSRQPSPRLRQRSVTSRRPGGGLPDLPGPLRAAASGVGAFSTFTGHVIRIDAVAD
ncbi:MAG: hypothetical protein ACTS5I_15400, partial [Rhodanobacter sp.]